MRSQSLPVSSRSPGPSAPRASASGRASNPPSASARIRLGLPVEAHDRVAHLAERSDRVREVRHLQVGLALERARGGLGERPGLGRGVASRGDDRAGAEDLGRAQDGADVVRVGDAVEQQHQRCRVPRGADLGDRAPVERIDLERRALVHRLRVERGGEAARIGDLGRHAGGGDGVAQPLGGIQGQDQAVADPGGVEQRVAHGVDSEEPDGPGRLLPLALALDRPGRFLRHAVLIRFRASHASGVRRFASRRHWRRGRGVLSTLPDAAEAQVPARAFPLRRPAHLDRRAAARRAVAVRGGAGGDRGGGRASRLRADRHDQRDRALAPPYPLEPHPGLPPRRPAAGAVGRPQRVRVLGARARLHPDARTTASSSRT